MVVAFPNASNSGLLSNIRCTIIDVVVVVVVGVSDVMVEFDDEEDDDSEMVAK